jgi:hypothetical protein
MMMRNTRTIDLTERVTALERSLQELRGVVSENARIQTRDLGRFSRRMESYRYGPRDMMDGGIILGEEDDRGSEYLNSVEDRSEDLILLSSNSTS